MTQIFITTPFIKLDSMLKFAGVTETGGQSKSFVINGYVFVNEVVMTKRGKKLYPGDIVSVKDTDKKYIICSKI